VDENLTNSGGNQTVHYVHFARRIKLADIAAGAAGKMEWMVINQQQMRK